MRLDTQHGEAKIRELAEKSATARRRRDLFGEASPQIPQLLKELGLQLRSVRGLQVRGMLARGTDVVVREGLSETHRRFVILHEVGHAVLLRDYPQLATGLEKHEHEEFAFHFALSLLLTKDQIDEIIMRFSKLESPLDLIKAANTSRLPLSSFLQIPRLKPDCLDNSNKLWLRCKFSVNRFTLKDSKLRIVATQYDRNQWYIPTNKGLDGVIEDTEWLLNIPVGQETCRQNLKIVLQRQVNTKERKYAKKQGVGNINAAALKPARNEERSSFLILMNVEDFFK
jgi:hypothetical protein